MSELNKRSNPYSQDTDKKRERIVVGLSGSLDSFVSAYLLKIQKYDVFAVTVAIGWGGSDSDNLGVLSCYISDSRMESIQKFCKQLNIPHHIVKAHSEFENTVVENWIAAKATGSVSNACWSCHELRIRYLYQKMKALGIKSFATGHFAKIFHHEAHQTYYVHSSNDEENDQSPMVAKLSHEILSALKLPLSDLQKKEVLALSENFGITPYDKKIKMHHCFPDSLKTLEYFSKKVPKSFLDEGSVAEVDESNNWGDHQGIFQYSYGQDMTVLTPGRSQKGYLSGVSFKDKKLLISSEDYFKRAKVFLVNCHFTEETRWTEPQKGVIKFSKDKFQDCWIYPKEHNSALIEWSDEEPLKEGEILTVFKKKGKNAKLLLTGVARFISKGPVGEENEEDEVVNTKVDYTRSF